MKSKKKSKIFLAVIIVLLIAVVASLFSVSLNLYKYVFERRFESAKEYMLSPDSFEGLIREKYTFASDKGQSLVGYKYYKSGDNKAVIVMAHGFGGGGHNSYMAIADYFASNGYIVFAYDATGNDESGGEEVGGMPQGVIDLSHAISFVKESPDFAGLPVMLFGHSWGAYSCGTVLNFQKDVKAAVLAAGFNKSLDVFEEEAGRKAGDGIKFLMPFVSVIDRIKFGQYASKTCTSGFESSDAGVMLIHSKDDDVVSFDKQFAVFREKYQNDSRFVFIAFENRGHNRLFNPNGSLDTELMNKITAFYDSYLKK